jgi:hypothetical protein
MHSTAPARPFSNARRRSDKYDKSYYDPILNDAAALANVDILGTHIYGTSLSAYAYPLFDSKAHANALALLGLLGTLVFGSRRRNRSSQRRQIKVRQFDGQAVVSPPEDHANPAPARTDDAHRAADRASGPVTADNHRSVKHLRRAHTGHSGVWNGNCIRQFRVRSE